MPDITLSVEMTELKINGEVVAAPEKRHTFTAPFELDEIEEHFFKLIEEENPGIDRDSIEFELLPYILEHPDFYDSDSMDVLATMATLEELLDFLETLERIPESVAYFAYVKEHGVVSEFEFRDKYQGEADSEEDFTYRLFSDTHDLSSIPSAILNHVDWEAVWNNELCWDYEVIYCSGVSYFFRK